MKKFISIVLVLCVVMMMFVACKKEEEEVSTSVSASEDTSVAPSGSTYAKEYSIGCIYSEITGDFWGIVYNGCMQALEELEVYGISGYCIAPANSSDYTLQMELIDTATLKGVDGITLSPSNADSIGAYVTDNFGDKDDMYPIVVIDRSLNTESKWLVSQVMADTWTMGQEVGKYAVEATGGEGKYVLYGISPLNVNWANRSTGAMDYIEKNAPDMVNAYPEEDGIWWGSQTTSELTFQFVQDICTTNPDDVIVFCTSTEAGTNTVVAATGELGARKDGAELYIVGYDFSMTGYGYLVDGLMYAAVGQNPYLMGYNSTYELLNYLETGEIEEFVYVPYCVVTLDNMETEEVQEYFESMQMDI